MTTGFGGKIGELDKKTNLQFNLGSKILMKICQDSKNSKLIYLVLPEIGLGGTGGGFLAFFVVAVEANFGGIGGGATESGHFADLKFTMVGLAELEFLWKLRTTVAPLLRNNCRGLTADAKPSSTSDFPKSRSKDSKRAVGVVESESPLFLDANFAATTLLVSSSKAAILLNRCRSLVNAASDILAAKSDKSSNIFKSEAVKSCRGVFSEQLSPLSPAIFGDDGNKQAVSDDVDGKRLELTRNSSSILSTT
uniref:Uncharacterized protein n=1 Tax=Romanomermis culicivorax TaxID=13658 RepID=A0A915JCG9_ROMCU